MGRPTRARRTHDPGHGAVATRILARLTTLSNRTRATCPKERLGCWTPTSSLNGGSLIGTGRRLSSAESPWKTPVESNGRGASATDYRACDAVPGGPRREPGGLLGSDLAASGGGVGLADAREDRCGSAA